jgi:hypothetical protein
MMTEYRHNDAADSTFVPPIERIIATVTTTPTTADVHLDRAIVESFYCDSLAGPLVGSYTPPPLPLTPLCLPWTHPRAVDCRPTRWVLTSPADSVVCSPPKAKGAQGGHTFTYSLTLTSITSVLTLPSLSGSLSLSLSLSLSYSLAACHPCQPLHAAGVHIVS